MADTPLRILVQQSNVNELKQYLQIPYTLHIFQAYRDDEIVPHLAAADAFITVSFKREWAQAHAALPLRLIQIPGAGTDGIDFAAVPPACRVCNVYGHDYAIAEYCLMAMLALNRRLFAQDAALRRGDWGQPADRILPELRGRTLLIIGMGHIGAEVARWARFIGMRIIGITRHPSDERARHLGVDVLAPPADLPHHLPDADFVVVATPQTSETTGMVGEQELRLLKPTAFLINVGRGPVVDEAALYRALHDRTIAGAALDVWYQYPAQVGKERILPSALPFHKLDNVIMTPHNAGWTHGTVQHRWQTMADNLRRLTTGEPLHHVVWPRPLSRRYIAAIADVLTGRRVATGVCPFGL